METEEKKWCVYIHRNKINNKAYIGIAKTPAYKRWGKNGNGYNRNQEVFYRAIQKYGWDNFEHIIWSDNLSQEEAKSWEIRLIALFKTNCCRYKNPEYGYNMTDGGDGMSGFKFSEESKNKMRKPHPSIQGEKHHNYGKHLSDEEKLKISKSVREVMKDEKILEKMRYPKPSIRGENNPNYGKHLSEEQKEKMLRGFREKCSGKDHPNYGKHLSEETKRKISEANKNPSEETRQKMSKSAKARCTDEWKEKMRNFRKGISLTEEHRQHIISGCLRGNNNPSARSIVQLNKEDNHIIKQWEYATLASNELGIDLSLIIRCCKGKAKTAGGFNWEYTENYQNNITLKES